jgi:ABC-type dipeptide/oligopeptide/nickel transport system permease component
LLGFLARRLLLAVPLLMLVLLATFVLLLALPGDPAEFQLGKYARAEDIARIHTLYGLDKPIPERFLNYAGGAVQGDLGRSYSTTRPITSELKERLPATIELATLAMILATFAGIGLGIITALKPRSWLDMGGLTVALAGVSMPVFFLGLIVIRLVRPDGWLSEMIPGFGGMPFNGRVSPEWMNIAQQVRETSSATGFYLYDALFVFHSPEAFWDVLSHLAVPACVLATIPAALIARITRASVGEALLQDYIRTAKAKGLPPGKIILRHALRNATIPIVTTTGTQFGYLLGGAVLTETIFSWPGLGTYTVNAITSRDWPQLQAAVLVVAVTFIFINLLVDLSYGFLDPRIRKPGKKGGAA